MSGCANFYIIYKTKNSELIRLQGREEVVDYINAHREYGLYDIYDRNLDVLCKPNEMVIL